MPKPSTVRIINASILPGTSINIPNDGDWFLMRGCLTTNCTFTRDQESIQVPVAKGDCWDGPFGDLYVTNNDPTRTEQITVWVGQGSVPKLGNGGAGSGNAASAGPGTDLIPKNIFTIGPGVTMQVVSAKNSQVGIWVMSSLASNFGNSTVGSAKGAFLGGNILTYIGGSMDLWIFNPQGGSISVYITVVQGV